MNHVPSAIWEHLKPVLHDITRKAPENIYFFFFFYDGPVAQYKQMGSFYFLSTTPFEAGFSGVTWNFFEAGQEKGAPDGVGGSIKRKADQLVRQRNGPS